MPRSVLVAALLALGCAQSSPRVRPLPATAVAIDNVLDQTPTSGTGSHSAPYTRLVRALQQYRTALESKDRPAEVVHQDDRRHELRRELFEELGEPTLVSVVERRCSSESTQCWRTTSHVREPIAFGVLLLREFGGLPTVKMLTRFEAKGIRPPLFREPLYRRLMEESTAQMPCEPPSARELDRAGRKLDDFVVVDEVSGNLVPRELTPEERGDLAYFMVAVAAAGPPPRHSVPARFSFHECSESVRAHLRERVQVREQALSDAEASGELETVARARQQYLEVLGFPGPVDACWIHGSGRFPYRQQQVMTCLAGDLEALGRTREAEQVYRRILWWRPQCASGPRRSRDALVFALIRTGERTSGCRRVVAERLRASGAEAYGPQRLAEAGFDLARLYRGALLTRNRDGDADELIQALQVARPELATRAIARLQRLGPEAWEERVLALEGLADSAQRNALEPLQQVLPVLNETAKLRALHALGTLAWRPRAGPVDCTQSWSYGMGGGSRPIKSLGRSCETRLSEAEARTLSRGLMPLLGDRSANVQVAAAETLGQVASAWSKRVLRRIARQRAASGGGVCSNSGCQSDYELREAATGALAQIDRAYHPEAELGEEEAVAE